MVKMVGKEFKMVLGKMIKSFSKIVKNLNWHYENLLRETIAQYVKFGVQKDKNF